MDDTYFDDELYWHVDVKGKSVLKVPGENLEATPDGIFIRFEHDVNGAPMVRRSFQPWHKVNEIYDVGPVVA